MQAGIKTMSLRRVENRTKDGTRGGLLMMVQYVSGQAIWRRSDATKQQSRIAVSEWLYSRVKISRCSNHLIDYMPHTLIWFPMMYIDIVIIQN